MGGYAKMLQRVHKFLSIFMMKFQRKSTIIVDAFLITVLTISVND